MQTVADCIFLGFKIMEDRDYRHEINRWLLLGRKAVKNLDSIKKQRHHCTDRSLYSQRHGFSSSCVWMWEFDHKEGWASKNWCFRIVVLEKTLESPLDNKEIKPEHSLEGLLLKLKLHYFGHLMWRANSLEKTLMLGKIEGREDKGITEDEMIGWHHRLNEHEFEQILRDSEGQGSLTCYSPWVQKESDVT